ncbi:hypothetical protein OG897_40190 [Streptomyces sp. NBC_00237]|uniref:hypothetical protein n=1 Tax=Streptomyces sp. NBC_00237 TaxID=2975687 RepID=UPI0022500476|nr:hypothetical protein [Streptomyces sp. NBC_00237]MCX5207613.1 hypothetical protein [Streptomyces sp. NBC_00237]
MTLFIDAAPGEAFHLSGLEPGFDPLHGIPTAALGEECDRLLAVGHLADRAALAITSAYHRRTLGELIVPGRELNDLIAFGTHRVHVRAVRAQLGDDCPWYVDDASPSHPAAQAATVIHCEWLEREEIKPASAFPACTRISRSTRFGPGDAGWASYHRCRHCAHQWLPPVAAIHPDLPRALRRPRAATHVLETPSCTRSA